jgi:hypothetical protein
MNSESIFVLIACIFSGAAVIYVPIWQVLENRKNKNGVNYSDKNSKNVG